MAHHHAVGPGLQRIVARRVVEPNDIKTLAGVELERRDLAVVELVDHAVDGDRAGSPGIEVKIVILRRAVGSEESPATWTRFASHSSTPEAEPLTLTR